MEVWRTRWDAGKARIESEDIAATAILAKIAKPYSAPTGIAKCEGRASLN